LGSGGFSGTWSTAWDNNTPDTPSGTIGSDSKVKRSEDLSLLGKHNVGIKVRALYTDKGGNLQPVIRSFTFDIDPIAQIEGFILTVDSSGNVLSSGRRDEDGVTTYITVTTDGTEPVDPNGAGNEDVSTTLSAWSDLDTTINASPDDTVRGKARAEDSNGNMGPVVPFRIDDVLSDPNAPALDMVTCSADASVSPLEITVNWTPDSKVTDADESVQVDVYRKDNSDGNAIKLVADGSEANPATNTSMTLTDSGGTSSDRFKAVVKLSVTGDADSTYETNLATPII